MKQHLLSGLRLRLLLLVLAGILPVLGMVTYFAKDQRDRTLAEQQARLSRLAKTTALMFDNLVVEGRGLLTALAQIPQVRDLDPAVADPIMAGLLANNQAYTAVFGMDGQGGWRVGAPRPDKPFSSADRDWFRRLQETRTFLTTDFLKGRITGKPVMALCYPVLNSRGEIQAVLLASISLDWLGRFFHSIEMPPGTHAFILDRDGAVLASYGHDLEAGHNRPDHPLVRAALAQRETVAEVASFSGQPFLFAIAALGDTGAKVAVGFSMESILSHSRRNLRMQLILLGVLTALGFAIAWAVGDFLVRRPVDRLLKAAARVSAGDLEAVCGEPYPPGEIGQLAKAFDGMTGDLKRLSAARAQQEVMERLKYLVAHTGAVLFTCRAEDDFPVTFISDNLTQVLGYEPREFMEDSGFWRNNLHPEDREEVLAGLAPLFEQGYLTHEYRFRHQDGGYRWLHDEVRLLSDEAGRPLELVGYFIDITPRKETEAALEKLSRRHQAILEALGEGVFGLDLNGNHTFVNPAAARMLGYEAEELVGRHSHSTWHYHKPDGSPYPEPECPFYATLRNGSVHHDLSEVFWRKDGTGFPVEVTTRPIKEKGKTVGAVASFRDISERLRGEAALKESEAKFRQIAETIEEVLWIASADHRQVFYVSPAYEKIWGRAAADIYCNPQDWLDAILPQDRDQAVSAIEKHVRGEQEYQAEYRIVRPDGAVRWIKDRGFPVKNQQGEVYRIVGLAADITQRKEMELQLRTLTQSLLDSLRETQEAQGRAEAANQAKSDLLANVGHELRTPLNAVTGFSQVLKDELFGPLNPKQRQYVDHISESAARLTGIINRIVEMAELSVGEVALDLTRMPLQVLLRLSLVFYAELAAQRGIALSLELGPGAESLIEVDPGKFHQIIFNLLENAVKFTHAGGAVTVSGGRAAALPAGLAGAPEDWVQVSVTDTGIGIRTEDLPRLFQEFVQLEAPLTKTYAGVGLGLAQTRRLVELHGGRIWAESQPGQGSAFIFILPIKHSPEKEQGHGQKDSGG